MVETRTNGSTIDNPNNDRTTSVADREPPTTRFVDRPATKPDRLGQGPRRMVDSGLAGAAGSVLGTVEKSQIEQTVDNGADKKTVEHRVGHVGS